jgi:multidrug efflux pump
MPAKAPAQQVTLVVDRDQAKRLGIDMNMVTAVLNNAYSQRQISTIYDSLNQYQVVMEVNPKYAWDPSTLEQVQVITADGARCRCRPLPVTRTAWPTTASATKASSPPKHLVRRGRRLQWTRPGCAGTCDGQAGFAGSVIAKLGGTADAFTKTTEGQPLMILGALVLVYLVLGILYESYIHPLTILSTLPSAGVGGLLAVPDRRRVQPDLAAGVVPADRRGEEERHPDDRPGPAAGAQRRPVAEESIRRACLLRLRPILMTTLAAILGACRCCSARPKAPKCASRWA